MMHDVLEHCLAVNPSTWEVVIKKCDGQDKFQRWTWTESCRTCVAFSFGGHGYIQAIHQIRIHANIPGLHILIKDSEYVEYKIRVEAPEFEQFQFPRLFIYMEYVAVYGVKEIVIPE